jgi:hypothetical protein
MRLSAFQAAQEVGPVALGGDQGGEALPEIFG